MPVTPVDHCGVIKRPNFNYISHNKDGVAKHDTVRSGINNAKPRYLTYFQIAEPSAALISAFQPATI